MICKADNIKKRKLRHCGLALKRLQIHRDLRVKNLSEITIKHYKIVAVIHTFSLKLKIREMGRGREIHTYTLRQFLDLI